MRAYSSKATPKWRKKDASSCSQGWGDRLISLANRRRCWAVDHAPSRSKEILVGYGVGFERPARAAASSGVIPPPGGSITCSTPGGAGGGSGDSPEEADRSTAAPAGRDALAPVADTISVPWVVRKTFATPG